MHYKLETFTDNVDENKKLKQYHWLRNCSRCAKKDATNWAWRKLLRSMSQERQAAKAMEERQRLWRSWLESIRSDRGPFPRTSSHRPAKLAGSRHPRGSWFLRRSQRQSRTELPRTADDRLPFLLHATTTKTYEHHCTIHNKSGQSLAALLIWPQLTMQTLTAGSDRPPPLLWGKQSPCLTQ